ncbi:hypothetical protein [uncultured Bosea sp.]|uniref:hypothetical protein n=1 Tax=uncultured Bosea sp. TaxID=211457 RepID=UPI0025EE0C13|nr:hypothetical protein [uncultured Bosea sp.]
MIGLFDQMLSKFKVSNSFAFIASVAVTVGGLGCGGALAEELFLGSELRSASAAGIVVSTFRRNGNGAEILKIRANSQTAQAFVQATLPKPSGDKPYDFFLEIGPPPNNDKNCSAYPATAAAFENCATSGRKELWKNWDIFELKSIKIEIKQLGFRSKSGPNVYASCAYSLAGKYWLDCNYFFEQGGHQHVLNTSSQALYDINLFRCAALELRNAIWTGAPAFADTCPQ